MNELHDCLIIGGGPAGLSAALVLGRCRRQVVVIDAGAPRNHGVPASHGVLTRDGTSPAELRRIAREQLAPYAGVRVVDDEVTEIIRDDRDGTFLARCRGGPTLRGKKLLLATGMRDRIPDIVGLRERWGAGIYVCPYCDGWEQRDRRLAMLAPAATGPDVALGLLTWSHDVILFTNGERVGADERSQLERHGVVLREERVIAVTARGSELDALVLEGGETVARDAVFLHFGSEQAAPFARQLGCELGDKGSVVCRDGERAGAPGVFVAGDASHDLQLVAVAIAEGAKAACAINTELRREQHR